MSASETAAHLQLKRAALAWAASQGFSARACEIRVPQSSYRADVVAYRPEPGRNAEGAIGDTVIFECKQSRADFLKDAQALDESKERLIQLHRRRDRLESLLGVHYPNLRRGDSLFPEYESVACETLEHETWQRVTREIRVLENRVHGKTKFAKMARYRTASFLYLVVTDGVMSPHELPLPWGILSVPSLDDSELEPTSVEVLRKPARLDTDPGTRLDLLQRLASATAYRSNTAADLEAPRFERELKPR